MKATPVFIALCALFAITNCASIFNAELKSGFVDSQKLREERNAEEEGEDYQTGEEGNEETYDVEQEEKDEETPNVAPLKEEPTPVEPASLSVERAPATVPEPAPEEPPSPQVEPSPASEDSASSPVESSPAPKELPSPIEPAPAPASAPEESKAGIEAPAPPLKDEQPSLPGEGNGEDKTEIKEENKEEDKEDDKEEDNEEGYLKGDDNEGDQEEREAGQSAENKPVVSIPSRKEPAAPTPDRNGAAAPLADEEVSSPTSGEGDEQLAEEPELPSGPEVPAPAPVQSNGPRPETKPSPNHAVNASGRVPNRGNVVHQQPIRSASVGSRNQASRAGIRRGARPVARGNSVVRRGPLNRTGNVNNKPVKIVAQQLGRNRPVIQRVIQRPALRNQRG